MWIFAWIVATALIVALFGTVDAARLMRVLAQTDARWLVLAVLANLLIQPFGALQWHALLPAGAHVPRMRMLRLFSVTSVANNTTPSLVGHVAGAFLVAAEPSVGTPGAVAMLALDQICVGLAKVLLLSSVSLALPLPEWMHRGLTGLVAIVAVLIVVALVVGRRTSYITALREPHRVALGFVFACLVKLCEGAAIAAVQQAFGFPVTITSVAIVLAASALASVVPVAPANIGTYETAAYAAYRFMGLPSEAALGIAVVQHVCQLLPAVTPGYFLLAMPRLNPSPTAET